MTTNQVTQEMYQYDSDGNISYCTVNGANNILVYDANNRLVSYNDHTITYNNDENGLLFMHARYYSPELIRFANVDIMKGSISDAKTLNYANGKPTFYILQ